MNQKKTFFSKHKNALLILLIVLVLAIAGGVAGIVVYRHYHNPSEEEEGQNLAEMMADLENEPVSDDDEAYEPDALTDAQTEPIRVMVNKTRNTITVYEQDSDGEYTVPVKAMNCSVGYNTPAGTYQTSDRYTWKIVNGNVWAQYATRITGNVLFHSVQYSEKDKSTLIAKYYNQLGTNASAGCIRVMASDAKWLMEHCDEGTEVEIYEDEDPGPLGKPVSIVVSEEEQWDPSDPDEANPWNASGASLIGAVDRTVERNITFDYLEGLQGSDTVGNDVTSLIEVETDLDITKTGTYAVKYTLTDGVGNTAEAEVTYTVVDSMAPCFSGIKKEVYASSAADVDEDELLEDVYVVDNNEILSTDDIIISVPLSLENGEEGEITYTVTDDYGNTAKATTKLVIDNEPPEIFLYADASSILSDTQVVDEAYALSRVYATDNGSLLSYDHIQVTIYDADWGYTFVYVATDDSGQTATLSDTVTYMSYTVTTTGTISVSALTDEQLMLGVSVTNSAGETLSDVELDIASENVSGTVYTVTYTYTYSSPLGTRTATASRTVNLKAASSESPSPSPSAAAATGTPAADTEEPSESPEPDEEEQS